MLVELSLVVKLCTWKTTGALGRGEEEALVAVVFAACCFCHAWRRKDKLDVLNSRPVVLMGCLCWRDTPGWLQPGPRAQSSPWGHAATKAGLCSS